MKQELHHPLTASQRQQILFDFNRTESSCPKDLSIVQVFERQAAETPDQLAVGFEDEILTYSELNRKANQLAQVLLDYGIENEEVIGIFSERSLQLIIGILAILKAGGAYLPIDSAYPQERILFMLEDAKASKILFQTDEPDFLPPSIWTIDLMDSFNYEGPDTKPDLELNGNNLAYVMYTSGSTGKPKGVMIEQKSVLRLVKDTNYIDIKVTDRFFQTGALSFDASTFDIWGALLNGASLYLAPQEKLLDATELSRLFKKHNITTIWLTSSFFNQLLEIDPALFEDLTHLLVGGDRLSPYHIKKVRELYPGLKLINGYGPTENTTFTCCYPIDKVNDGEIPIGFPISNTQVYILDENNSVSPIGSVGEICISGDGLARGYLNDPELNAKKFVENPLVSGVRMYRTGDLGKWDENGAVHFMGRNDQQVKIRGFRVEPGEIENRLLEHPEISEATIQVDRDEQDLNYLIAYYVSQASLSSGEIRTFLQQELPEHLIPSYFVPLEQIPLTVNGKTDRNALPKPTARETFEEIDQVSETETQEILSDIWKKVLNLKQVGIHDDFFDLGGHSLKALQISLAVQQQFAVNLNIRDIFAFPSVFQLAKRIENREISEQESIPVLPEQAFYELSYAQKRLWLMSKMGEGSQAFNVPSSLKISGKLDLPALERAVQLLADRHESLRTYFVESEDLPYQKILPGLNFRLLVEQAGESWSQAEKESWLEQESNASARRIFNLAEAPLWQMKVLAVTEDEHYVLINFHHIISDGWSITLFSDELLRAYSQLLKTTEFRLPKLKVHYKDFAAYQNRQIEKDGKQGQYWQTKLSPAPTPVDLPEAAVRPEFKSFNGSSHAFSLNPETTAVLKSTAIELKITDFILIRSILNLWIYQKTAVNDITIGTPVAGRNYGQMKEVFGYFINMLPLRDQLNWNHTIAEVIREINQSTLDALENEEYPMEKMLQDLNYERDASRSPLFDLGISWQNFDEIQKEESLENIQINRIRTSFKYAKYDLWLFGHENGNQINLLWEYNTDLFDEEIIKKYTYEFSILAHELPKMLDKKLIEIRNTSSNIAKPNDHPNTPDNSFEFNF